MPAASEARLRAVMSAQVGVIRNGDGLTQALRWFAAVERNTGNITLRNMAITALLVAASAWARRESRGAHYRTDAPDQQPAPGKRTVTTLAAAREIAASLSDHIAVRPAQPITA
jgi:L-aspartate oxidase